jgi:hypothetical protein
VHPWAFLVLALAAYRTTVLAIDDRVPFAPLREWIWARWPYGNDPHGHDPADRGDATASWIGRRFTDRHRAGLARIAGWWKDSWAARVRTRDSSRPGSTKIGYLWTCPWCMGAWHAAGWYAAWLRWPTGTLRWATLAAIAAGIGVLYRIGNES